MSVDVIRRDVDKTKNTPIELKEDLHYGRDDQWELSMDKVKPRKFLDDEFVRFCNAVREASKQKTLAEKLLPTMEAVLKTSEQGKATVYKAVELMETMDPLVQYSYTAEEYAFQLEGRCRRILDQYDSTYKEVIVFRNKTDMDQVETKTADCLNLLEESIRAAEEDIASWTKQKTTEDARVRQEDIKEKNSIAQDLIREENDELKLIESHCNEDLNAINKKLGELDSELKKIKMQRDSTQMGLKGKLKNNRDEQERLRERLRQLEEEDADLSKKIDQNNMFQTEADQEYERCTEQVRDMQKKIMNLLEMTNASIQLMKDMAGCVSEIVQHTSREKNRVLKDLEQKELHSDIQLRDALMAKIVFHNIRMEEVTNNLQETKKETAELNKDLRTAAKSGNKPKVTRLKETISLLEAEENSYTEKRNGHEKELYALQERCKQVDKKIYASGKIQLATTEERVKKWKAEQDKCFDNPDTGQFHSNITKT